MLYFYSIVQINMKISINMLCKGACSSDKKSTFQHNFTRHIYPNTRQNLSSTDSVDLRNASGGGCHVIPADGLYSLFFKLAANNTNK